MRPEADGIATQSGPDAPVGVNDSLWKTFGILGDLCYHAFTESRGVDESSLGLEGKAGTGSGERSGQPGREP